MADPRLYLDADLAQDLAVPVGEDAAHYLTHVLRRGEGDLVRAFNARDGEWSARIGLQGRKRVHLVPMERLRPPAPDNAGAPWLVAAPTKGARFDWTVEKAAELGAARILPVTTRRTVVARINEARLMAHAREAAEQCERLDIPALDPLAPLEKVLGAWPAGRVLLFCDEGGDVAPLATVLAGRAGPFGVLIGPEGGFDPAERTMLRALPFVVPVGLGDTILRADTAAVAALALVVMRA